MHALLITYRTTRATAEELVRSATPYFAGHERLLSKVWLDDAEDGRYGGFYVWRDRTDMDEFLASPVFRKLTGAPGVTDVTTTHWPIAEEASRATRGLPA
ncbi:YdhR family protein [Catenuloplanes japonicus]|uniref:YdhR family protein n=1 Tax=Catenuloplanes japonicus TaxID=33876 RepID=UPI000524DCD4|nr:YdhR family protein [Catenuloplanes japonicus]